MRVPVREPRSVAEPGPEPRSGRAAVRPHWAPPQAVAGVAAEGPPPWGDAPAVEPFAGAAAPGAGTGVGPGGAPAAGVPAGAAVAPRHPAPTSLPERRARRRRRDLRGRCTRGQSRDDRERRGRARTGSEDPAGERRRGPLSHRRRHDTRLPAPASAPRSSRRRSRSSSIRPTRAGAPRPSAVGSQAVPVASWAAASRRLRCRFRSPVGVRSPGPVIGCGGHRRRGATASWGCAGRSRRAGRWRGRPPRRPTALGPPRAAAAATGSDPPRTLVDELDRARVGPVGRGQRAGGRGDGDAPGQESGGDGGDARRPGPAVHGDLLEQVPTTGGIGSRDAISSAVAGKGLGKSDALCSQPRRTPVKGQRRGTGGPKPSRSRSSLPVLRIYSAVNVLAIS